MTDQCIAKNSKVEIQSDVAINLFRKRLPSAGCPCKRKSWFDHNVIIRGYVYASSVVHATEIHRRSLIGAHTCMRVYTNSANLMHSLNGSYPNHLRKKYIYVNSIQMLLTCTDCLLNNHVVLSEHRNSCYWKTSAQSGQKMGLAKITQVCKNTF